MGTLTSILEHVWSLFQGNFIFLLDTLMGTARSDYFFYQLTEPGR